MDPRFEKMSKNERKKILQICEFNYTRKYRRYFPDLPESIRDLDSKDINAISAIEGITGQRGLLVELLRLKRTVDGIVR